MATSINGWPVIEPGDPLLATATIPGTDRRITMRVDVLPLFLHYAARYNRWIAPVDAGPVDDWGYAYRKARVTATSWSDHSSGTALDLNATKEGAQGPARLGWWKRRGRAVLMRLLLRRHRVLMWGGPTSLGGEYEHPANWDFMHVAIKPGVTPARVYRVIDKLRLGPDGRRRKRKAAR